MTSEYVTIVLISGEEFNYYQTNVVRILYTNYKGETSWRRIVPYKGMRFEATEYHTVPQWILHTVDIDKRDYRSFAMQDIYFWLPEEKESLLTDHTLEVIKNEIIFIRSYYE